ncbi:MAG: amidohydrolase family protein, partial [Pseudomonadota bacterium]
EGSGFRGIKLYPPLGYSPSHPVLMDEIYPYCVENDLPVMSHCSRGGVRGRWIDDREQARLAGPDAFIEVLETFPRLRVCLAHFGGEAEWDAYLGPPMTTRRTEDNWLEKIRLMLESGTYPNLYTDISYTVFKYTQNVPALDIFLSHPRVARRVLFGSDFYLTEREGKSERRVSIELRHGIGDAKFRMIAETNPAEYLGV